ncbi:hypothetical protein GCM10010124_24780 [Pilimelia terevasa]|uniref:Uncharacterized protein n=1 Tax=Pilimelia terevasa TaxID=53372 RepID=A0A8J3BRZ1_9ACTN|nr:hypothetical protein [Pilimelia terevasa]GGK30973.1 hypothetical protein GCM10010124_24780 [Pilimelia terevasa]
MSPLERRYRRALRLLPDDYRRRWEEDMVATFLEAAYAAHPDGRDGVELGGPGRAELASVAGLALRLRLGGDGAPARAVLWGAAVRRVALVGLLAGTVTGVVGAGAAVWAGLGPAPPPAEFGSTWQILWRLSALLWLPAFAALLTGHRRAAAGTAAAAFLPALAGAAAALAGTGGAFALSTGYGVLFDALPLAALAAFHADAPAVRHRPWMWAAAGGVLALPAYTALARTVPGGDAVVPLLTDWAGLWCAGLTAAAVVGLASRGRGLGRPPWRRALLVLGLAAAGLRLTSLADHLRFSAPVVPAHLPALVGLLQLGALVAALAALAGTARGPRDRPAGGRAASAAHQPIGSASPSV